MNISHSRFILFKLKIFGEIVTTFYENRLAVLSTGVVLRSTVILPVRRLNSGVTVHSVSLVGWIWTLSLLSDPSWSLNKGSLL